MTTVRRRIVIVVFLFWWKFLDASLACPSTCDCNGPPDAVVVSCTERGLKKPVNPDDLPSNTIELDMSGNEIELLGSKAFKGKALAKVKKIIISHNKISQIAKDTFSGLNKLQKIDLSHNRLSFPYDGVFRSLKNLKKLDLSRNKLLMLNRTQFSGCRNLKTINLSNNKLSVLPDGLFNSLASLQTINLQLNPIICDCNLKWMVKWISSFKPKGSSKRLSVQGRCEYPLKVKDELISSLNRKDMDCDELELPVLDLSPQGHQVAFSGDHHSFKCRSSWIPDSTIDWYKDGKLVGKDDPDKHRQIEYKLESEVAVITTVLKIDSVKELDSGLYSCNVTFKGGYVHVRKSHLSVISHGSKYCKAESSKTDRGTFNWDRTAAGGFASLPCPVGIMGRLYHSKGSDEITAKRSCSVDGEWLDIKAESCAYANDITQALHRLKEQPLNETSVYAVSKRLLNISRRSNEFSDSLDVIFAADVIDKLFQAIGSDKRLNRNLVETISNLADADDSLLAEAQETSKSCLSMITALDLFHTRFRTSIDPEVSVVTKNIAVQVVRLSLRDLVGKTCIVTTKENVRLNQVECVPWRNNTSFENHENFDSSIHLPPSLFQQISREELETFQQLKFQFIVYFNSKLFPDISNGSDSGPNAQITSSVVSAQIGGDQFSNLSDPIVIKYRNHKIGEQAIPVYRDVKEGGGHGRWMQNNDCNISSQGNNTIAHCYQLSNKDFFAVMMFVKGNEAGPLESVSSKLFSLEPIVFIGAGICCLLILVTLVTYIVFRELRFNRDDAAMLMNECLTLLVVVVVFVAGINHVTNVLVCRAVGVLLHYFLLCSLLWIGCGGICLCRLIRTSIQPEEYNPVLRYYMISWGIPLIICGITIAGNPDNYNVNDYCWLRPHPFYGAFVGPACLIVIVDLVIFCRLRNMIKNTYEEPTHQTPEAAETATEENALVLEQTNPTEEDVSANPEAKAALPDKDDLVIYLRGSCCILLLIILTVLLGNMTVYFQSSRALYVSLSCLLALAVVVLGVFIFIFHCYQKEKVRSVLRKSQKCWCMVKDNYQLQPENAEVENADESPSTKNVDDTAVNGEAVAFAVDEIHGAKNPLLHGNSDSQSNVSLPSSAAITIDKLVSTTDKDKGKDGVEKAPSVSDKQSCASAPLPSRYSRREKLGQHTPGYRHSYTEPSELPPAVLELRKAPIAPPEATASSVDSSVQQPTDSESNAAPSEGRMSVRDTAELLNASRNTNTSRSASERSVTSDHASGVKRPSVAGSSCQGSDRAPVPPKKIRGSATMPTGKDYQTVHRPDTIPEYLAHHSVAEATTNSLPRQIPRDHVLVREQYHIPYEPRALSEKPRDHYQILPLPRDNHLVHYPIDQDPRSTHEHNQLSTDQNVGQKPIDQFTLARDQGHGLRPPDHMIRDQSPVPRLPDQHQIPRDQGPGSRLYDQYHMPRDQNLSQRPREHHQVPRDFRTHDQLHMPHDRVHGQIAHEHHQFPREQIPPPSPREQNTSLEKPGDENEVVDPSRDQIARRESGTDPAQESVEHRHNQYAGEGPPLPRDSNGVRPHGAARGSRDQPAGIHVPRRRSRNPYQIARDIHLGLERSRDAQTRQVKQAAAEQRSQSKPTARETVPNPGEAPRERTPRSSMSSWKEERPKPGPKDWVCEPPKTAVFVPVPHLKRVTQQRESDSKKRNETSV